MDIKEARGPSPYLPSRDTVIYSAKAVLVATVALSLLAVGSFAVVGAVPLFMTASTVSFINGVVWMGAGAGVAVSGAAVPVLGLDNSESQIPNSPMYQVTPHNCRDTSIFLAKCLAVSVAAGVAGAVFIPALTALGVGAALGVALIGGVLFVIAYESSRNY